MVDTNVRHLKKNAVANEINNIGISIQPGTLFVRDSEIVNEKNKNKPTTEKCLAMNFRFSLNKGDVSDTEIFLERPKDDSFVTSRKRLNAKLHKLIRKAEGKVQVGKPVVDLNIFFNPENEIIDDASTLTNDQVLLNESINNFIIGEEKFRILRQRPNIEKFDIDMIPIVGCPVICVYECNNDIEVNPNIYWYISPPNTPLPKMFDFDKNNLDNLLPGWKFVSSADIFYPTKEHTGMCLAAILDIGEDTIKKVKSTGSNVVHCYEEEYLHKEMVKSLKKDEKVKDSFRIFSFNILADLYLNLKQPQEKLYFSYCPKEFQEGGFRYPLILKVLADFDADIMALQEVDYKMQKRFLLPFLERMNYDNYFAIKGGLVNEGVVISWKKSKFKLIQSEIVLVKDLLDLEMYFENRDVVEFLKKDEEIDKKFRTRPTVLLCCLLEDLEKGVKVLVSTTHLHFDPRHENIKCLQALLCWRYIEKLRNNLGKDIKILFCGDFNVTPEGGAVQLSLKGYTEEDEECWECTPSMGGYKFKIQNTYQSLCQFPRYTNFTYSFNEVENKYTGFEGTLDYIWGDNSIKVINIANMPKHEDVVKYGALPSKHFPSDHLPICCEITFY
uniref:Endo/exonuclease/phosphatase domain-containing protein n=1 Tax=Parastrongyloides trichosuri TaxID=131310 RepID=A0A0N4ZD04_PARTI